LSSTFSRNRFQDRNRTISRRRTVLTSFTILLGREVTLYACNGDKGVNGMGEGERLKRKEKRWSRKISSLSPPFSCISVRGIKSSGFAPENLHFLASGQGAVHI